jgi:3-deoxy-manno-octulosonate cytidylyltransferase (CMP-KDO synthetase)
MIQHVYENALRVPGLDRVLVATDDRRIFEAVKGFAGDVVMTSKSHMSGTDRLAEAARKIRADWVINLQGDLPFVRPRTIHRTYAATVRDDSAVMGTARTPIRREEEWRDANVVKVVTDRRGMALYFSRAPIPHMRGGSPAGRGNAKRGGGRRAMVWGYRHIGIYVYRRDFLFLFSRLRPTDLERVEGLEQLRALSHGYRIKVTDVDEPSVEVDSPKDLRKAEKFLRDRER